MNTDFCITCCAVLSPTTSERNNKYTLRRLFERENPIKMLSSVRADGVSREIFYCRCCRQQQNNRWTWVVSGNGGMLGCTHGYCCSVLRNFNLLDRRACSGHFVPLSFTADKTCILKCSLSAFGWHFFTARCATVRRSSVNGSRRRRMKGAYIFPFKAKIGESWWTLIQEHKFKFILLHNVPWQRYMATHVLHQMAGGNSSSLLADGSPKAHCCGFSSWCTQRRFSHRRSIVPLLIRIYRRVLSFDKKHMDSLLEIIINGVDTAAMVKHLWRAFHWESRSLSCSGWCWHIQSFIRMNICSATWHWRRDVL